jgi:hypothetical protein
MGGKKRGAGSIGGNTGLESALPTRSWSLNSRWSSGSKSGVREAGLADELISRLRLSIQSLGKNLLQPAPTLGFHWLIRCTGVTRS